MTELEQQLTSALSALSKQYETEMAQQAEQVGKLQNQVQRLEEAVQDLKPQLERSEVLAADLKQHLGRSEALAEDLKPQSEEVKNLSEHVQVLAAQYEREQKQLAAQVEILTQNMVQLGGHVTVLTNAYEGRCSNLYPKTCCCSSDWRMGRQVSGPSRPRTTELPIDHQSAKHHNRHRTCQKSCRSWW